MSTSSLTALPSLYATSSDHMIAPEISKPARKTYGKRREATPPLDTDGPSLSALFTTSTSPQQAGRPVRESPSKALLSRWSTGDASWKTSLMGLGMDKEDDDEDVDPEEIKRELALMRGKARGEKSSPKRVELPPPTHDVAPRKFAVSTSALKATTSSSTLSAAPSTSPLRSSPPPRSSAPGPVARVSSPSPSSLNKPKALVNLFDTSSDHEDDVVARRHRSSTPASRRSVTPTPGAGIERARQPSSSSPRSDEDEPIIRKAKPKKNRIDAFMAGLDGSDEDANTPKAARHSSRPGSSPNVVADFMATLEQSDEEDAETSGKALSSQKAASDPVGLFDDEHEERDRAVRAGKTKIKGLAKKDLSAMQKDVARAQRERAYEPFKPEAACLPISTWAMSAAAILNNKPELAKDNGSPMSSSPKDTPHEEITAFTPSSRSRPDANALRESKRQTMVPGTSSPTPGLIRVSKRVNSDDEVEEAYEPLKDFKDLINEEQLKAEVIEARRRILERKKQERLRTLKWTGKGRDVGNSDDELSILPKGQPAVRFADVKPSASRKTPRGFIDDYVNSNGGKHRQVALQFTGKKPVKEEVTETMAEFAGKTFKHADLRTMNGGSRPAGQKVNRDKAITQANLDAMTMKEHRQQAQRIQRKKEQDFGIRKKHIPARETRDYNTELAELQAIEARRYEAREEEEDEDPEDGDYQGSGEEEDDEVEVDLDEEVVQYSGEEDGVAAEEDEQKSDSETEIEVDQEEQIDSASKDKIETNEKASSPAKVDSLAVLEQETPRPARDSTAKASVGRANPTPQALESTFVDVSGFGSGGGSPGFSQLFEATQAPGFGETDAFAGLRDQHAGLLPANALLPQVDISATQIERDNAVIAADLEDEDADVVEDRPRTQYMNEKGLFTQTRPQARPGVSAQSSRNDLAGSSAMFEYLPGPEEAAEIELSSTQRDTSEGELGGDSATQQSESPPRDHSPSSSESNDDEGDEDQTTKRPADAFTRLMAADQRPLTKHQKQAKARIRSNLVDEQADESDEDNWLMPGQSKDEDEDEEEDQDAFLPGLVNDEEVSEEERRRQDALVAAKNREIQLADDAKREAEARKVTEGQYRTKRRGKDFYSDDEDEGNTRSKRWSKKQRRARKEWKEDGLDKLDGEENVFRKMYEQDLDSDVESVDEAPSPRAVVQSPVKMSESERRAALRRVAQINKAGFEDGDIELDEDMGFEESMLVEDDDTDVETQEETQYSVSRVQRTVRSIEVTASSRVSIRSTESYQNFVRDESQTTRRVGAIGAASVIYNKKEILPPRPGFGSRGYNGRPPVKAGTGSSSSSGSILLSKTNRFA